MEGGGCLPCRGGTQSHPTPTPPHPTPHSHTLPGSPGGRAPCGRWSPRGRPPCPAAGPPPGPGVWDSGTGVPSPIRGRAPSSPKWTRVGTHPLGLRQGLLQVGDLAEARPGGSGAGVGQAGLCWRCGQGPSGLPGDAALIGEGVGALCLRGVTPVYRSLGGFNQKPERAGQGNPLILSCLRCFVRFHFCI